MAMEINRSKQLHKHAVPVLIALAVLLMASAGAGSDLFKRVIKIRPSPNGLAKVSIEQPVAEPKLNDASRAGSVTSLSFELH